MKKIMLLVLILHLFSPGTIQARSQEIETLDKDGTIHIIDVDDSTVTDWNSRTGRIDINPRIDSHHHNYSNNSYDDSYHYDPRIDK